MKENFDFKQAASDTTKIFGRLLDNTSQEFTKTLQRLVFNIEQEGRTLSETTDEELLKLAGLDEARLAQAGAEAKIYLANMFRTGIARTRNKSKTK